MCVLCRWVCSLNIVTMLEMCNYAMEQQFTTDSLQIDTPRLVCTICTVSTFSSGSF